MKTLIYLLAALTSVVTPALAQDALHQGHGVTPSGWVNLHVGDPHLAGTLVRQYPADPSEKHLFKGKHPFVISFVMWDGSVNETYYDPEGRVVSAGWWRLQDMKAYDPQTLWKSVDFSQGSDPTFKQHNDPRIHTPA